MSIWGKIAGLEHELTASRQHAKQLESELVHLRAQARHVDHARPLPRAGVDYSFDRPSPEGLRRAGATFALRYLTGEGKALSMAEAKALSAAGLAVGCCFESSGHIIGEGPGRSDAKAAAAAAHAIGVPADRPIYFVCDFDAAGAGETAGVMHYLAGAGAEIGWHRVGLYAGYDVIEAAHAEYRAPYLWQTLAWSGGRWSAHAQLRQTAIEKTVAGVHVDLDEAMAADFGQWRI